MRETRFTEDTPRRAVKGSWRVGVLREEKVRSSVSDWFFVNDLLSKRSHLGDNKCKSRVQNKAQGSTLFGG